MAARRSTGMWGTLAAIAIVVALISNGGLGELWNSVQNCATDAGPACDTSRQQPSGTTTSTVASAGGGSQQEAPRGTRQRTVDLPAPTVDETLNVAVIPHRPNRDGYRRDLFGTAWTDNCTVDMCGDGCTTRENILARDLTAIRFGDSRACPGHTVMEGVLHDPYTGETIQFVRGEKTSAAVQIDHVIALSAAYDLGAGDWPEEKRINFANDPDNLLAVDGPTNQQKSDKLPGAAKDQAGRAWMPPNTDFACQYATSVVTVARKYDLPLDQPTVQVLTETLADCPDGVPGDRQ